MKRIFFDLFHVVIHITVPMTMPLLGMMIITQVAQDDHVKPGVGLCRYANDSIRRVAE